MNKKIRLWKSIFVLITGIILVCAILTPAVVGKPSFYSDKIEKTPIKSKTTILKNNPIISQIIRNIFGRILSNNHKFLSRGILDSYLHTNCDGVEKTTVITFSGTIYIDVDNDPNTGNGNGEDIQVQFFFYPWIEISSDIGIGLVFSLEITRLGDEIKNSDFSISLEVGNNNVILGYSSPNESGNEVPYSTTVNLKIFFYLLQRTRGFNLYIEPFYVSGNENKKIQLFSEINSDTIERSISVGFNPPIETDISLVSTKEQGVWQYNFYRESTQESEVTVTFTTTQEGVTKETILSIDKLPKELVYSLGLTPLTAGGGHFYYESSDMYNIKLQVWSNAPGAHGYLILRNTPRKIISDWIPTLNDGEYHIKIDSDGTDFVVRDSETNPLVNFEVTGLGKIDIDAYWNFTNPGDFTVYKNNTLNVGLDISIGDWVAQLDAKPTANYIATSWHIDSTGYLTVDTNGQPFTTMDLLIKAPLLGLHTIGEGYKAQDFRLSWTLWPPEELNLTVTGWLTFTSADIDIYLIDTWRHLWPWENIK